MLHPDLAKKILNTLLEAEEKENPLTLEEALARWGQGSTWESLVDGGHVERLPEAVTVTGTGKQWLDEH